MLNVSKSKVGGAAAEKSPDSTRWQYRHTWVRVRGPHPPKFVILTYKVSDRRFRHGSRFRTVSDTARRDVQFTMVNLTGTRRTRANLVW